MKILFVENKHKTVFWETLAKELVKDGHDIYWIVQNKLFKPSIGEVNVIPKPSKDDLEYSSEFKSLESKDRYCYIYHQMPLHYVYYSNKISQILNWIVPDIVFGEATLFHELLTIESCKKKDILYLTPSTCRYPNGRFSFYKYDTQIPYSGSGQCWSDEHVSKAIEQVITRQKQPDYMKKPSRLKKIGFIARRFKGLVYSYMSSNFFGEIYNTPLLRQKRSIELSRKSAYEKYELLAISNIDGFSPENTLIFPLQMQPESNIDVWGAPYNNQSELIVRLSKNLGESWNILIKPNPKSKYEVSSALLDAIETCDNVYALKHVTDMKLLFDQFKYFFSVTGTINHESILAGKKCFSPSLPITHIFTPNRASIPTQNQISSDEEVYASAPNELMRYLIDTSYVGLIGDNIHTPHVFEQENLQLVVSAFRDVLIKRNV
jgi:hypothetical protein